jgi:hypothetical protein
LVRIVDQAVENAVGGGGITDLLVQARDGKLRGQNRRARLYSDPRTLAEFCASARITLFSRPRVVR